MGKEDADVEATSHEASHPCQDKNCQWPCKGHQHDTGDTDLVDVSCDSIIGCAAFGCSVCTFLADVVSHYSKTDGDFTRLRLSMSWDDPGVLEKMTIFQKEDPIVVEFAHSHQDSGALTVPMIRSLSGKAECDGMTVKLNSATGAVCQDRASDDSISMIEDWVQQCKSEHDVPEGCSSIDGQLPWRVLDVRKIRGDSIRLVTADSVTTTADSTRYLALSYCWGGAKPLTTTSGNLEANQSAIDLSRLPQTWVDLVHLARRLDIAYVWIDALCIIQDSTEDWENESARMGQYYRGAYLVIIASAGLTPFHGFLKGNKKYAWHQYESGVLGREMISHLDLDSQTARRAWCYQERMLARRCLVMSDEEMTWECRAMCKCECSGDQPFSEQHSLLSPQMGDNDLGDFWRKLIMMYSTRLISFATDRLPACSAIAKTFSEQWAEKDDIYLAGLWKNDPINQLSWVPFNWDQESSMCQEFSKASACIAPSWSWASHPGAVTFNHSSTTPYKAELVSYECKTSRHNPFGRVSSGHLNLRGYQCQAQLTAIYSSSHRGIQAQITLPDGEPVWYLGRDSHPTDSRVISACQCCGWLIRGQQTGNDTDIIISDYEATGTVLLFWLTDRKCLVLGAAGSHDNSYGRLGLLFRNDNDNGINLEGEACWLKDITLAQDIPGATLADVRIV